MAKRTAQELWDALDEATLDAEIESALAMTPEERRQALIEDGCDIDALHADADAFFASLPAMRRRSIATQGDGRCAESVSMKRLARIARAKGSRGS